MEISSQFCSEPGQAVRDLKDHLVPAQIYPCAHLVRAHSEGCMDQADLGEQSSCRCFFPSQKTGATTKYWICKGMTPSPSVYQAAECSSEQSTGTCVIYLFHFPAPGSFGVVGCHLLLQRVTCSLLIPSQQAAPTDGEKFEIYLEHL